MAVGLDIASLATLKEGAIMSEKIPESIETSMDGVPVEDLICLEAGTGAGNMTYYLAKRKAKLVYSISNNQEHLDYACSRLSDADLKKVRFINANLSNLRLSSETIDLITAHMLISVVPPVRLFSIFKELTRVAKKDALMVVNDYNPLSSYQTERSHLVEELFRIENTVHYLVKDKPALVWYPHEYVTDLLQLLGWKVESAKLLYPKTPWPKELLQEHIDGIKEICMEIDNESTRKNFLQPALEIFNEISEDEVIYGGSIYSIKIRRK